VLAAALADVVVRDPHPRVALGLGDHPLQGLPVALLDPGAARELVLRLAQAGGEPVADPLEIADAQDPRAAGGDDLVADPGARERCGEELRELLLEGGDLTPQVTAGASLGIPAIQPGERRHGCARSRRLGEHLLHHPEV
jgi:hypothetical protein